MFCDNGWLDVESQEARWQGWIDAVTEQIHQARMLPDDFQIGSNSQTLIDKFPALISDSRFDWVY